MVSILLILKTFSEEILFCVELIASSFLIYLISKQARLKDLITAFLSFFFLKVEGYGSSKEILINIIISNDDDI